MKSHFGFFSAARKQVKERNKIRPGPLSTLQLDLGFTVPVTYQENIATLWRIICGRHLFRGIIYCRQSHREHSMQQTNRNPPTTESYTQARPLMKRTPGAQ